MSSTRDQLSHTYKECLILTPWKVRRGKRRRGWWRGGGEEQEEGGGGEVDRRSGAANNDRDMFLTSL